MFHTYFWNNPRHLGKSLTQQDWSSLIIHWVFTFTFFLLLAGGYVTFVDSNLSNKKYLSHKICACECDCEWIVDSGDGDDDEGIELFYSTNYPMPYSIAHPNIRTENK